MSPEAQGKKLSLRQRLARLQPAEDLFGGAVRYRRLIRENAKAKIQQKKSRGVNETPLEAWNRRTEARIMGDRTALEINRGRGIKKEIIVFDQEKHSLTFGEWYKHGLPRFRLRKAQDVTADLTDVGPIAIAVAEADIMRSIRHMEGLPQQAIKEPEVVRNLRIVK